METQRPEALISLEELDKIAAAATLDFTKYKRSDNTIYCVAWKRLSYDHLTFNWPKADTHFMPLSDESFMHKLALCVAFTDANRAAMPPDVQDQYCLRSSQVGWSSSYA